MRASEIKPWTFDRVDAALSTVKWHHGGEQGELDNVYFFCVYDDGTWTVEFEGIGRDGAREPVLYLADGKVEPGPEQQRRAQRAAVAVAVGHDLGKDWLPPHPPVDQSWMVDGKPPRSFKDLGLSITAVLSDTLYGRLSAFGEVDRISFFDALKRRL